MWAMNASNAIERAALVEAINRAGGKTALMRLLNARGHTIATHNVIAHWGISQVPAHYCPDIEHTTGVLCESLRPDVAWGVLRESRSITARTAPSAKTAATAS